MKKFKKIIAAALALCMTGCSMPGSKHTLTIHMNFFGYCVYNNDWPIFKEAEKKTGIALKGTTDNVNSFTAFNTMLSSKKLPDIIHFQADYLNKAGQKGSLIPLNDLIEEHAPHIKEIFDKYEYIKNAVTAPDGNIYYIPYLAFDPKDSIQPSKAFFIRTDWLDKLGLETPKTVDEYKNVLKAFKEGDPNGNGLSDEVPYFERGDEFIGLYQLFGAKVDFNIYNSDTVKRGEIQPEFKNAVKNLAQWYKEGLVYSEIYTSGQSVLDQLFSDNRAGSTFDWISSTSSYNGLYAKSIPGLKFESMLPPADINGNVKCDISRSCVNNLGWGISKDNKYPEQTMKYFDFWMSKEGEILQSYGVENVHYTKENGKYKYKKEVLNAKGGVPTYMRTQGQVEIGVVRDINSEILGMNKIGRQAFESYKGVIREAMPYLPFSSSEQEIIDKYLPPIELYIDKSVRSWIMGNSDVESEWDEYLKEIDRLGMNKIEKIYNAAYVRYN